MSGNDSNTLFLIQSNTTDGSTIFADTSFAGNGGSKHSLTVSNVEHSTDQAKIGSSSILGLTTNAYLVTGQHSDFAIEGKDFTIDSYIYITEITGAPSVIFHIGGNGFTVRALEITFSIVSGAIKMAVRGRKVDTTSYTSNYFNFVFSTGQFYHIAVERYGDNLSLYVDGVFQQTQSVAGITFITESGGNRFVLGYNRLNNVYLDEVRFSNKARYTGINFTPPVSSYTGTSSFLKLTDYVGKMFSGESKLFMIDNDVLMRTNTDEYVPTADYHPVTKKYVDDNDAIVPAHKSSHASGGSDVLSPADIGAVANSLFDANTILVADTDNTPAALTVAEQTLVGRITSGNIVALTAAQVRGILGGCDMLATLTSSEVSVTTTATLDSTAFGKMHAVECDDQDVDLPNPSGNGGKWIGFRFVAGSGSYATVARYSTEKINAEQRDKSYIPGEMAIYYCDGTDWIAQQTLARVFVHVNLAKATDQSVSASGYTTVDLALKTVDTLNAFNTTTHTFTAPAPGLYDAKYGTYIAGLDSGTYSCALYNSSDVQQARATTIDIAGSVGGSASFQLAIGDTLLLKVHTSGDTSYTVRAFPSTFLQITRIDN